MADDLTKARDWIYILCTVFQTLLAIFALLWWERRNRKQDQQKAHVEKIIAILTKHYYGAVEKFRILKEHVNVLKRKKTGTGSHNFTEFDVLLYMCHEGKFYANHSYQPLLQSKRVGYGKEEVMQAVTEVMKLFEAFDLQLPTIHRACPDNIIKSEFSTEIKEMGEIIDLFVTESQQELIKRVLKYLGSTDSVSDQEDQSGHHRCKQCCFPCRRVRSILRNCGTENARAETQSLANTDSSETMEPPRATYPVHDVIPYIEHFRYENGELNCKIECTSYPCIKDLETLIMKGVPNEKKDEIQTHIRNLWPPQPSESDQLPQQRSESDQLTQQRSESDQLTQQRSESDQLPQGDLLHLIRMVMFKLLDNPHSNFFGVAGLDTFVKNVEAIVKSLENVNEEVVNMRCKRAVGDLHVHIQHLLKYHQSLLKDQRTLFVLEDYEKGLKRFMTMMLSNAASSEREQSRNVYRRDQAKHNIYECLEQVQNEGLLEDEMALFLLQYYAEGLKTFTQWTLDVHCRNASDNMDASTEVLLV